MSGQHRAGATESSILDHYQTGYEAERLAAGPGQLEQVRTQEILARHLPPPPASIVDIGGGPGVYTSWLASRGYTVQLLDIVALHVEQARQRFERERIENAGAEIGDARALPYASESRDAALLLGPLYHLTERDDRLAALREARRVLRPGGLVVAAAISRFASLLDGFYRGFIRDPVFLGIVEQDLDRGQHENPSPNPFYFTTAFFHRPDEVAEELEAGGFSHTDVFAVEGPFWSLQNFDDVWSDAELRGHMLRFIRQIEREPALIGASAHLLGVGRKPES